LDYVVLDFWLITIPEILAVLDNVLGDFSMAAIK